MGSPFPWKILSMTIQTGSCPLNVRVPFDWTRKIIFRLPAFPATTTLYRNAEVLLKESISDNAYHEAQVNVTVRSASKLIVAIPADEHHDWYDFTIRVKGNDTFSQRYAGRFETGQPSKTDPFMGRV